MSSVRLRCAQVKREARPSDRFGASTGSWLEDSYKFLCRAIKRRATRLVILLWNHPNLSRRCPRLIIDFRKRLEFNEAAWFRVEGHDPLFFAFAERALFYRLPEVLAIVAQIEF